MEHGTRSMYINGKCRCELCSKANRDYNREHARTPSRKASVRLWRYGITQEQFDAMIASQNGLCACCSHPPTPRGWMVDHDHKTGAIRGLLCVKCNVLLGQLGDNVAGVLAWCERLLDYLNRPL